MSHVYKDVDRKLAAAGGTLGQQGFRFRNANAQLMFSISLKTSTGFLGHVASRRCGENAPRLGRGGALM
ncbi:hypothetical protein AAFF_G00434970 [Aldrovandia affinis]|uniref:Uncharacterized protein n=1 Tax=Aldrovandia affinis TaxID=143900 RepID=A0AAD7S8D5_9TELE|nr:hypothetical protein AAFF_G00434970 [Aldrovandia affinis]